MLLVPLEPPKRVTAVPPIYRAILLELERRRLAVGISMDRMSELMGSAERSYAKMLYPETPSGRMARWETLQSAVDVLFCDGYELRIKPTRPMPTVIGIAQGVLTTEGTKRKIKAEAATWNRQIRREVMDELSQKATQGRKRIPPWKRRQMARHAARVRWRKVKAERTAAAQRLHHEPQLAA